MAVTTIRASASSRMVREGIGIEDAAIRSDGWPDGGSAAAADKLNVAIVADSSHRRREIVIDMKIPLKIARNAPRQLRTDSYRKDRQSRIGVMTRTIGKVGSGQPPAYRSNRKSMKRWTLGERRVAGGRASASP